MSRSSRLIRVAVALDALSLAAEDVLLEEGAARYVTRVHRLGAGEHFVAFDPSLHAEADAEILQVGRRVLCRIGPRRPATALGRPGVTLLQALGKGDKPEQVIRDATALGAERVILIESRRAVVRLEGERMETRRKRWRTVAIESARQCGRGDLPELEGPLPLAEALSALRLAGHRLCLSPSAPHGILHALRSWQQGSPVAVLIGPEGGLDADEEGAAFDAEFVPVRLGELVLRTETAAVAALAVIAAVGSDE